MFAVPVYTAPAKPAAAPAANGGGVQVSDSVNVKLPFWGRIFQKRLGCGDFWLLFLTTIPLNFIPFVGNLIALYFVFTFGAARLQDTNRSGWLILLTFIPFVGNIILIVFWCLKGTNGPNKYGPVPQRFFGK